MEGTDPQRRTSLLALERQIWALLNRRHRRRFAVLAVVSAVNAVLEALGAGLILALISSLVEDAPSTDMVSKIVRTVFDTAPGRDTTIAIGLLTLGFYIVKNVSSLFEQYAQQRSVHQAAAEASTNIVGRYLRVPMLFHLTQSTSTLVRNASASTETVFRVALLASLAVMSELLSALALIVVLVAVAPTVTPWVILSIGVVMVALYRALHSRMTKWGEEAHNLSLITLQTLQESFGAMRDTKLLAREGHFVERYRVARVALARSYWRAGTAAQAPRLALESAFVVVMVITVVLLTLGNANQGTSVGLLGLFSYAGLRLMPSANRMIAALGNIRFGQAAVGAVIDALSIPQEDPAKESESATFDEAIEIHGVTFAFPASETPAVCDVSLRIERGESIGIVGRSGSGKSTLADIIVGLLHPTAGTVTVDGADIANHLRWWRHRIGYVSQAVFLLNDTLRVNIAFGLPDQDIDDDRVQRAITDAQMKEFVGSLPDGLQTRVGERGVRLSGGQRQRIAVARALYEDPALLVFDEATSALDRHTEEQLTSALEAVSRARTVVTVAHRIDTVRGCDRLVFMEAGRIVDVAPYTELLERNAAFRQLVSAPA